MKQLIGLLFLSVCLLGCASLTPRQQAYRVDEVYAAVLTAAQNAVTSPLLASNVTIKAQIKSTTQAATSAILAYSHEADKCLADANGVVGNAPGQVCNQSEVGRLLVGAEVAATNASQILASFGFVPSTGANPSFTGAS